MTLWHPGQGPSGPLQQGAYLGVLLYRELPPNRGGQLGPAVGTADQPPLVLDDTTAAELPTLCGRGLLCADDPTIS